jgi:hypothetical protein
VPTSLDGWRVLVQTTEAAGTANSFFAVSRAAVIRICRSTLPVPRYCQFHTPRWDDEEEQPVRSR